MNDNTKPSHKRRPLLWLSIHWIIILNFLFEIAYASYMVFFIVVPPDGGSGPLASRATSMPFEFMMTRRLYATEFWIAFAGLAIYLAITELYPRFWRHQD